MVVTRLVEVVMVVLVTMEVEVVMTMLVEATMHDEVEGDAVTVVVLKLGHWL